MPEGNPLIVDFVPDINAEVEWTGYPMKSAQGLLAHSQPLTIDKPCSEVQLAKLIINSQSCML
jgi:hypothetical protein